MKRDETAAAEAERATEGAGPPGRSPRDPHLAHTTMAGVAWLTAQTLGARVISFGSQIALARILLPASFGELALAGTITAVVGVLISFGVDDVLLQRLKTIRFWTAPAFWMSLGFGVLSMVTVCFAAPLAAALYKTPQLVPILFVTALSMPLGALSTVPTVMMRSALKFRFLAVYATIELIVTQAMMVILALKGFGVFSFVIPGPIMALAKAAIFWSLTKPRLGKLRLGQLKNMWARGSAVIGSRLVTTAVNQGDYFVLGLMAPKPILGAYYFGFRLAIQPVQMLAGNLSNVLFPALVQLAGDPIRQRDAAIAASRVLAFVVMPYCFMQAAAARPLMHLAFGEKWRLAIPLVQILSIGLAFDAVSWVAGSLLSARGEFKRAFVYSCAFSPIFFVLVTIGAFVYSAIGVAIAVSLFYLILAPAYSFVVFSYGGVGFKQIAAIYTAPVAIAALSMGGATAIAHFVPDVDIAKVAVIVSVGGVCYLGLTWLLVPTTFAQVVERLSSALRSKRGVTA